MVTTELPLEVSKVKKQSRISTVSHFYESKYLQIECEVNVCVRTGRIS